MVVVVVPAVRVLIELANRTAKGALQAKRISRIRFCSRQSSTCWYVASSSPTPRDACFVIDWCPPSQPPFSFPFRAPQCLIAIAQNQSVCDELLRLASSIQHHHREWSLREDQPFWYRSLGAAFAQQLH